MGRLFLLLLVLTGSVFAQRARDLGVAPGLYPPGEHNAITDVPGVLVGQRTLIEGDSIRTGVTAILPHSGNLFQEKVPAAAFVFNAFGKSIGLPQIQELGVIETPILLTNTLAVWRAADALRHYTQIQLGNEDVRSVNAVVGETNDGRLNDIRAERPVREDFLAALADAKPGPVEEGAVGAGTGTICFGWKGGIGTSSRRLPGGPMLGVLVQTNFGGTLLFDGLPLWKFLKPPAPDNGDGSIMMIVAVDAPLDARQLQRVARRATFGLARTGSNGSHGSGDFVIAFSTNRDPSKFVDDGALGPFFQGVIEATEEAIYNSLLQARAMTGRGGYQVDALDARRLRELLEKRNADLK
ncbi:MAG: P1 family peptidase [Bryobacterales bacterium]|nr:P1 family peptidase [Bryobacterales bacterium]